MPDLQLTLEKTGRTGVGKVVAIDTEWAKNWKAEVKMVPFCATVHVIDVPRLVKVVDLSAWTMKTDLYFRAQEETASAYAEAVDAMLQRNVDAGTTIVGHQISSDLHLLRQVAQRPLPMIDSILSKFHSRHSLGTGEFVVRDTRYDIRSRVRGNGGEKLRNASLRLRVFAVQNELDEASLTQIYNRYRGCGDQSLREKLMVLNWRHAFQTALVWIVDSHPEAQFRWHGRSRKFLLTNDIIHAMARDRIPYVSSSAFQWSRSQKGISAYVRQYAPLVACKVGLV